MFCGIHVCVPHYCVHGGRSPPPHARRTSRIESDDPGTPTGACGLQLCLYETLATQKLLRLRHLQVQLGGDAERKRHVQDVVVSGERLCGRATGDGL